MPSKNRQVIFRVNTAEEVALVSAAEAAGLSVSEFAKRATRMAVKRREMDVISPATRVTAVDNAIEAKESLPSRKVKAPAERSSGVCKTHGALRVRGNRCAQSDCKG